MNAEILGEVRRAFKNSRDEFSYLLIREWIIFLLEVEVSKLNWPKNERSGKFSLQRFREFFRVKEVWFLDTFFQRFIFLLLLFFIFLVLLLSFLFSCSGFSSLLSFLFISSYLFLGLLNCFILEFSIRRTLFIQLTKGSTNIWVFFRGEAVVEALVNPPFTRIMEQSSCNVNEFGSWWNFSSVRVLFNWCIIFKSFRLLNSSNLGVINCLVSVFIIQSEPGPIELSFLWWRFSQIICPHT